MPPASLLRAYKRLSSIEATEDGHARALIEDILFHVNEPALRGESTRQEEAPPPPSSPPPMRSSMASSSGTTAGAEEARQCSGHRTEGLDNDDHHNHHHQHRYSHAYGSDDGGHRCDDDDEFVHLTVLSANNLSSLLSYGDLEGGYAECVVEEDLEVTLGQLLTSPDCQYALIAGEEGAGKTVLLRRILREFDRIPTPSATQPLLSSFPIGIHCARLISHLLSAESSHGTKMEEMESHIDPVDLLLRSAALSWQSTTSSTSASLPSPSLSSRMLRELLCNTGYPFVLLLDGLDTVPRDLANELLFILLGQKDCSEVRLLFSRGVIVVLMLT